MIEIERPCYYNYDGDRGICECNPRDVCGCEGDRDLWLDCESGRIRLLQDRIAELEKRVEELTAKCTEEKKAKREIFLSLVLRGVNLDKALADCGRMWEALDSVIEAIESTPHPYIVMDKAEDLRNEFAPKYGPKG